MTTKIQAKIIHEGEYMAEVSVEMTYTPDDWSPYLSLQEAEKLDRLRLAFRQKDLQKASQIAKIYHLTPIVAN